MHLPCRGETKALNDFSRTLASGRFVQLTGGLTHYRLSGPDMGKTAVLVHGIAGPFGIWQHVTESLTVRGIRVLEYDLYGRGYSDRPDVTYDIDLFLTQLRELLVALRIDHPFTLVGWSLGGMIAAAYTARFPKEVGRVVLIAPAGIDVSLPAISRFGMAPVLGDMLMSLVGRRLVLKSLARGLHRQERESDYVGLISEQMQYRGYLRAFLSTLRNCVCRDSSKDFQAIGVLDIPVSMISGSEDQTIPLSARDKIAQLIPNIVCREIEDAGHVPQIERPEALNSLLAEFV